MIEPLTTADDKSTQDDLSANPAIVPENENKTIVIPQNKNEDNQPPTLRAS